MLDILKALGLGTGLLGTAVALSLLLIKYFPTIALVIMVGIVCVGILFICYMIGIMLMDIWDLY